MPTINAIAHLNMLTKDVDNDYYLNAQVTGTLYPADIVERLRKREIATKNVDGEAFVQTFLDECAQAASEGYNIVTSFFRSSIGIQEYLERRPGASHFGRPLESVGQPYSGRGCYGCHEKH